MSTAIKRMFPAREEQSSPKRRRGPKSKDEKMAEAQKTAEYWLMRPHLEFLEYRREVLLNKMNFYRKEYSKYKTILDKLNSDIEKHKEDEEDDDDEDESEEEVEVQDQDEEVVDNDSKE